MVETLFEQQLNKKILVLDGAMGTMIQQANLTAEDFGGEEYEGCNEYLLLTAPHVIKDIHIAYLEAGADVIETNTFGATSLVLDEYRLGHLAYEINLKAAEIARQAVDTLSTPEWPRFVAGAMGPTTKTLSVTGGATFDQLISTYEEQAKGLLDGGVDLLLLETSQDMLNVKAGFIAIQRAFEQLGKKVPIMVSGTIEPMGTTLAGQSIEAFYLSLEHMKPVAVGLNCATGPEFMTDHIRSLAELAQSAVSCYPNAGLPDEEGLYHETPESIAKKIGGFAAKGWLNITGGCCGTTPAHIEAIAKEMAQYPPRQRANEHQHAVSGIEPLIYDESMRPLFVGERTNVIGSRKFKRLIAEGKFEEAAEIARAQVKRGAHVIDICLADPDRDELEDMIHFMQYVTKLIKVPLVIDSTDDEVIEKALSYSQGKAIINSINLEDGEERFEKILPLIHRYGAAVVVGTIDEKGMAVTAEDKLRIAKRSYQLLVQKYKLNPRDIIFDPLVFPVGTGDEQYIGSAKATVEGIRMIKEHLPHCLTMLGISNVSFGLPPVGREVLNAVFLYHCTQAGLDYAIVNTEKLERFASIPKEEVALAEKLLFETTDQSLAEFTAFYREKKVVDKTPLTEMNLEERLANYILEGTKEGLIKDLEEALSLFPSPLDIINGPLMDGMAEVGRLFNQNELIVAEVLQSAEVMKASVAFLEPHMEKSDKDSSKGKIILATVKGDVHDIGKNLVDIILSNNGFRVVDLGIKVPPHDLIEAVRRENPDAIGLSGLLVKSAQQMVITAQDLKQAEISIPILVGGAALSRKFTDNKISPEYEGLVLYAKDAMDGLAIANQLQEEAGREKLQQKDQQKRESKANQQEDVTEQRQLEKKVVRSNVSLDVPIYQPKDLKKHILRDYSLDHIEPYINQQMLLGHHLGLKGKVSRLLEERDEKTLQLKDTVDSLLAEVKQNKLIKAHAVYQFFPALADKNDLLIFDPENPDILLERFSFPRQNKAPYLCLADYLRPVDGVSSSYDASFEAEARFADGVTPLKSSTGSVQATEGRYVGEKDYVGFFTITTGKGIRELAQVHKEKGEFLLSHALQALALEMAEGFAELVHQLMRDKWGFSDPTEMTMQDRFSAKYQGQRYSFGYPACPHLEDQEKLFRLIQPEDIGVHLTDGFMMEPEASVSAIVFAHPEARYFNVQI